MKTPTKYSIRVYKETLDEWYPNFPMNLVLVSLMTLEGSTDYRVCVWGADDCGMEKDYKTESAALTAFMQIIGAERVNKYDLLKHEFIHA